MKKLLLLLVFVVCAGPSLPAQAPARSVPRFALTVDSIMRGPALVGYPPDDLRWSGDSQDLYFEWRRPGDDEPSTWVVGRDGGALRRLSDDERRSAPPAGGVWDTARRRVVAVQDGDIVVIDTVARTRRAITRTSGSEANPRWARRDTHVTFTRDNSLFIVPVDASDRGVLVQVTEAGPKKADPKLTDSQKFVTQEEGTLIGAVKERGERRERREAKEKALAVPKFDLQERETVTDAALSGDERFAYLLVSERAAQAKTVVVPNYVSDSGYTEEINSRTKVGDAQARRRVAVLDLTTGKAVWTGVEGVVPELAAGSEAPAEGPKAKPRDVQWSMPRLAFDGSRAVASARAADNNDRWLVAIDPATGKGRVLDHLHDDAWVRDGAFGWLPDHRRVWFLSERDGWMHLYTVDATAADAKATPLTSGRWEVFGVELSPDRTRFVLTTSEVHPGERHVYTMGCEGGARTKLTSMVGSNEGTLSPDGSTLALVASFGNKPPEVYLMPNRAGAAAAQATTSTSEEWRAFKWVDPQLVRVPARDGVAVPARLFTPEMVGATRDPAHPGVVFVHGAGYMQNVHKFWSSYYREYMFHHVLASRGYVVLDVDYRGSAGYGRDWRTAIYRHMGGTDLDDIVDGAKYLVDAERVHPRRIGVYGGSYGGFITLMAMFTSPKTFAAGAALRPVTDWAHYNHPYTANILNEPQTDAEAYRKSSPIYFAEGLQGALLICHGVVDVNVNAQDSIRLAERLIELRKENWELALYPVEDHGFERETSWADEYRRILKLFEKNLRLVGATAARLE